METNLRPNATAKILTVAVKFRCIQTEFWPWLLGLFHLFVLFTACVTLKAVGVGFFCPVVKNSASGVSLEEL